MDGKRYQVGKGSYPSHAQRLLGSAWSPTGDEGEGEQRAVHWTLTLLSVWQKRGVKKSAILRSSPSLAEVKKKGRMKKLSQTAEQDLIMGLQGLVRGSWDNQNPKVLHPGQCGMFLLIQALNPSVSPIFFLAESEPGVQDTVWHWLGVR